MLNKGLSLAFSAIMLLGCVGEGETSKSVSQDAVESPVPVGSEGGIVRFDNTGTLNVETGALPNGLTLSVEVVAANDFPDAENSLSKVYSIAPIETALFDSAELSIPLPSDYQAEHQYVLARLINNTWVPNFNSRIEGNFINAEIYHLGIYGIRRLPSISSFKSIGPACDTSAVQQTIRFVHVADLHSRFGYKERLYSRLKSLHLTSLDENPYTVFTNGGDDYEKGNVAEQVSMGRASSLATQAMEFDVRVVGNHDYAWGEDELLAYAQDETALVLASNTQYVGDKAPGFPTHKFGIIDVGCVKVGFLGMTSGPWNELDKEYKERPLPDFIDNFVMDYEFTEVAEGLVRFYGEQVDYLVMVSHLGWVDDRIAQNVPDINLILGGHSHDKPQIHMYNDNKSIVIEPDIYGMGATVIDIEFNLFDKTSRPVRFENDEIQIDTMDINTFHEPLDKKIAEIVKTYLEDPDYKVAISENYPDRDGIEKVLADALIFTHKVDAVFLGAYELDDPFSLYPWQAGGVTQQELHDAFPVERQPSNTLGFNAVYSVEVSGAELEAMIGQQPQWQYFGEQQFNAESTYTVALYKGAALNPALFFTDVSFDNTTALNDSWRVIEEYGRYRTSQCLHLDSDTQLNACKEDEFITVWQFDNSEDPFLADYGPSTMKLFNPENKSYSDEVIFKKISQLDESIPTLAGGDAGVMKFPRFKISEGLKVRHNVDANGDFTNAGLVSDYSLVVDVLWPSASVAKYRPLLQTSLNYESEIEDEKKAEIRFESIEGERTTGGVGFDGFCGEMLPDTWYRIALVFYSAPYDGTFKVYINGELACEKTGRNITERFALADEFLLLTDGTWGAQPGYLNAALFAGRTLSETEIKMMGGPSAKMTFSQEKAVISDTILRHQQSAPGRPYNPWLEQRNKFFK